MKAGYALAALLTFAILTLWVAERWSLSGVEVSAYLAACVILIVQRGRIRIGIALLAPALMCVWAAIQWSVHWSVVPSATADAWLYWLAAACFVLLGSQVDRETFLKSALGIGAVVCVAGIVQLFTSRGDIFWLFPSGFDRRVIGPFVSPNNYAAFVELLIPIALSRRKLPYLLIAAALAATVVASGSRAGAVLVLAEIVTVLAWQKWNRRALLTFALLTAALSLIAGQQFLTARFGQKADAFAVRREFLQSSVAMFRAEPLHGFGLGTWPSAYPQFAIVDTGETANHAHNEWAQWAAEGGIPALAFMLGLLLWTVRPAMRSVWGIGILAVFAHSLVDYPFLRLGLAAWVFAFLGTLSSGERSRRTVPVAAVIPVLLFGAWQASKLAYADTLYRRATLAAVERAATFAPDRADYYIVLAQLDSSHAVTHFERAIAANPYETRARFGLAMELEAAGNPGAAAQLLLEAARNDHQFAPAWALANFYFRTGESDRFWIWAQRSAAMSYGNRRAFFDLCFLVSADARVVFEKVVAAQPEMEMPFLEYLIFRHRIHDAEDVAGRIAHRRAPDAGDALSDYIDAAMDAGETAQAWRVRAAFAGTQPLMVNGDFAAPLLNRGFDWKIAAVDGISVARTADRGPALAVDLSGREPESCKLLSHALALEAGATYVMRFEYRTMDLPPHTGVSWQLLSLAKDSDAESTLRGRVSSCAPVANRRSPAYSRAYGADSIEAARDFALDSSPNWKPEEWRLRATGAGTLTLAYHRMPGSTRAEGRLLLRKVRIDAAPL